MKTEEKIDGPLEAIDMLTGITYIGTINEDARSIQGGNPTMNNYTVIRTSTLLTSLTDPEGTHYANSACYNWKVRRDTRRLTKSDIEINLSTVVARHKLGTLK
jgi:hypothetical protein